MPFCSNCGQENADDIQVCTSCGQPVKPKAQAAPQQGAPVNYQNYQPQMIQENWYQPTEYQVQQKLLSLTKTYKISDYQGIEFMVARKKILTLFSPLVEVTTPDGTPMGQIKGNFWKTEWTIYDADGQFHAKITFPFFMLFRKSFTIETPIGVFQSGGSVFGKRFDAYAPDGRLAFVVDKKIFSVRDTFKISSNGQLGPFITCLAAVLIDMKFHSDK